MQMTPNSYNLNEWSLRKNALQPTSNSVWEETTRKAKPSGGNCDIVFEEKWLLNINVVVHSSSPSSHHFPSLTKLKKKKPLKSKKLSLMCGWITNAIRSFTFGVIMKTMRLIWLVFFFLYENGLKWTLSSWVHEEGKVDLFPTSGQIFPTSRKNMVVIK